MKGYLCCCLAVPGSSSRHLLVRAAPLVFPITKPADLGCRRKHVHPLSKPHTCTMIITAAAFQGIIQIQTVCKRCAQRWKGIAVVCCDQGVCMYSAGWEAVTMCVCVCLSMLGTVVYCYLVVGVCVCVCVCVKSVGWVRSMLPWCSGYRCTGHWPGFVHILLFLRFLFWFLLFNLKKENLF